MNRTLQLNDHLTILEGKASSAAQAVYAGQLAEDDGDHDMVRLSMSVVLSSLAELAAECAASTDRAVGAARKRGMSWDDIGRALGISRQAAHARFHGTGTTTTTTSGGRKK